MHDGHRVSASGAVVVVVVVVVVGWGVGGGGGQYSQFPEIRYCGP